MEWNIFLWEIYIDARLLFWLLWAHLLESESNLDPFKVCKGYMIADI